MKRYIQELCRPVEFQASVVFTSVMAPYAPPGIPMLLDMVDVDSEKWFQYARTRYMGSLYKLEAQRLRRFEADCVKAAENVFVTTRNEERILRNFVKQADIKSIENGVDSDVFDGERRPLPGPQTGRQFLAFIGTMDYYPNCQAATWFTANVFRELRRHHPDLEFWIIGRKPVSAVKALEQTEGVRVLGEVADTRPYLAAARAVIAPLQLARGMQNKVLEALSMGRSVYASTEVCRTFGEPLPRGIVQCDTAAAYVANLRDGCVAEPICDPAIREESKRRFNWEKNLEVVGRLVDRMAAPHCRH